MRKIIIQNETSFGDDEVLGVVSEVIQMGRISNGGYCYATTFDFGIVVLAFKNKNSDRFIIRRVENGKEIQT